MANTLGKIIADFNAVLSLKVAVGATTATISTATDDDGVALPAGNYFFTIDRNSSSKEYIYCALSGTSLSSIQSVSRQGVLTPGFARSHRAKTATVEITDFATLRKLADYLDGTTAVSDMTFTDITFTGTTTPGLVIKSLTTTQRDALSSPGNGVLIYNTTAGEFQARQGGAWVTVSSGSTQPNASTEVAGKVEMATSAESIAGTDTGGTGALLSVLPSDIAKNAQSGTFNYGTDTGGDDTYVVALTPALTTYTVGQELKAKMTTPNNGACTIDFGPGPKNVKLQDGTDPLNGQVGANIIHSYRYDGTNLILDNPVQIVSSPNAIGKIFTLNENMTAGDVGYVDSMGLLNTWDGYKSSSSSLGVSASNILAACMVDTNTVILAYGRSGGTFLKAGTISGDTITWGAEYGSFGNGAFAGVCKIDTNAGCLFSGAGTAHYGMPFTVSGTTISTGTQVLINSATDYAAGISSICQVDTNKVCFAYQSAGSGAQSRIGTISSNTLSVGTEVSISFGVTVDMLHVVKMSTSKVGFLGKQSGTSTIRINAATISGNALTMGTSGAFVGTGTVQNTSLVFVDTDKLVTFYSSSAPNLYSRYLTVSGTTVTAQSEQLLVSGGTLSTSYQGGSILVNNNTIAVTSSSDNISYFQVNNSNYILNLLDTIPYNSTIFPYMKCLYGTNKMIGFNLTHSYFVNNNARFIVGILQETGTAGQLKKVTTTGGVSSVHSSLLIGEPYYAQVSGGIGLQSLLYKDNVSYNGISKIGKAISSTEILVNIQ